MSSTPHTACPSSVSPASSATPSSVAGQPRIRPAMPADSPRLAALANEAYALYVPRMGKKPGPMTEDYDQRVAEGAVFVLEVPQETKDAAQSSSLSAAPPSTIAGFVVLIPEEDALLLDNVAVDPATQGRGYGKKLLAFAEFYARKAGFNRIKLYTNEKMTENLALYPRLGYVETHRAEQAGFNRVFFAKSL